MEGNHASKRINTLLGALLVLDIVLSVVALFIPEFWSRVMHGVPYDDPQGLLRRTGATWVAFTLFQGIALARWRKEPFWLVVVAGLRWSEIITDWIYLYFCQDITLFGRLGLFVSPPVNILAGWYLIKSYQHCSGQTSGRS